MGGEAACLGPGRDQGTARVDPHTGWPPKPLRLHDSSLTTSTVSSVGLWVGLWLFSAGESFLRTRHRRGGAVVGGGEEGPSGSLPTWAPLESPVSFPYSKVWVGVREGKGTSAARSEWCGVRKTWWAIAAFEEAGDHGPKTTGGCWKRLEKTRKQIRPHNPQEGTKSCGHFDFSSVRPVADFQPTEL